MRKLSTEKRTQILTALVEGNSINATRRMCGVSKLTVLRLLSDVGQLCHDYHDLKVRGLNCQRVQVDEIWSFVGCKQRTKQNGGYGDGDCWTWVAVDAETKLVVSYLAGLRDSGYATEFCRDVANRVVDRIQLTSDGHKLYLDAVADAFGENVDYSMLRKVYGNNPADERTHARYSPPTCIATERHVITGNPDPAHINTSYVERQNLTLRMGNRRFTRLTNAFSKKWTNHEHAIALHYFYYNFCRKHQTIGTTPAMAAGIASKVWKITDLVALLEREERLQNDGGRINRADRA